MSNSHPYKKGPLIEVTLDDYITLQKLVPTLLSLCICCLTFDSIKQSMSNYQSYKNGPLIEATLDDYITLHKLVPTLLSLVL